MTFGRRLRFYGIGVSLGLLVVAVMFGPRAFSCSYFPNARVLEEARMKPPHFNQQATEMIAKLRLDSAFVYSQLLKRSTIDFDKSKVRDKPCRTYFANYKNDTTSLDLRFRVCADKMIFDSIHTK